MELSNIKRSIEVIEQKKLKEKGKPFQYKNLEFLRENDFIKELGNKLSLRGQILVFLFESYLNNRFVVNKTIWQHFYHHKEEFKEAKRSVNKIIGEFKNKGYIKIIRECPTCGKTIEKPLSQYCDCGFKLIEEDEFYIVQNKSHWPQYCFKISKRALDLMEHYFFLQKIESIKFLTKSIEFHKKVILEKINKLETNTQGLSKLDFFKNKNDMAKLLMNNFIEICSHIEKIKIYKPQILKNNAQIPWENYIKIGKLIRSGKWALVYEKVWKLTVNGIKDMKLAFK